MKQPVPKILMVDDDAEDRSLLKDTMDDLGLGDCIHFEENGEKAIEYLRSCSPENGLPCLVVLDLNMPKLNGKQTLQSIRNEPSWKSMTIIIYSTSLNPRERDECLAMGAHSYVVKPISYKESVEVARMFYNMCTGPAAPRQQ